MTPPSGRFYCAKPRMQPHATVWQGEAPVVRARASQKERLEDLRHRLCLHGRPGIFKAQHDLARADSLRMVERARLVLAWPRPIAVAADRATAPAPGGDAWHQGQIVGERKRNARQYRPAVADVQALREPPCSDRWAPGSAAVGRCIVAASAPYWPIRCQAIHHVQLRRDLSRRILLQQGEVEHDAVEEVVDSWATSEVASATS